MSEGPWVLGISASHNGAACLMRDGRICVAIQEERLSGEKRERIWGGRPSLAVRYCFDHAGIDAGDLAMIVVCTQSPAASPAHDTAANPQFASLREGAPVFFISHHLGHAASAFATSGLEQAAVLVIDGVGSPWEDLAAEERVTALGPPGWETATLYRARGTAIEALEKHLVADGAWLDKRGPGMARFGGLGGMYGAVSQQIFGDAMEAGKVMGLAANGIPTIPPERFFTVDGDGRFVFHNHVPAMFPGDQRWPQGRDAYENLAASVQAALEEGVLRLARRLRRQSGLTGLCYTGGVALNSVANERLIREAGFDDVHIVPAAEDSGPAIGAAWYGCWSLGRSAPPYRITSDALGASYDADAIARALDEVPGVTRVDGVDALDEAVRRLADGEIGGWFQGGSELGPRALGQRSILCDARKKGAKFLLNARIKGREPFRPFAPAILAENVTDWFDIGPAPAASPFMLRVLPFKPEKAVAAPAVVHSDGSGRPQTVCEGSGPLRTLLERFHGLSGVPLLLNTSFNVAG